MSLAKTADDPEPVEFAGMAAGEAHGGRTVLAFVTLDGEDIVVSLSPEDARQARLSLQSSGGEGR